MPHSIHHHNLEFVVLSLIVAVLGSWTALDLFRRVRSHIGQARRVWLGAAAVAMGLSIWSMHFVAMLGFDPGSPVSYDLGLTFLSLFLAMAATGGAFLAAASDRSTPVRLMVSGAAMGVGICLMHYVGMAALRTAMSLGYQPAYVVLSFAIAIVAATAALWAARRERSTPWRAAAAVILGLAIAGMHYTAMAGVRLTPGPGAAMQVPGAPPLVLGASVAAGTLVILLLALLASLYDQRLNVLSALEAGRVGYWELSLPSRTLHLSGRAKEIVGGKADAPMGYAELLARMHRDDLARRDALLAEVLENEREYDAEYRFHLDDGSVRWVHIRGRIEGRGHRRRMTGIFIDVTDRRDATATVVTLAARQTFLIDELNHRVKNTLAAVQSIARQTAKGAPSVDAFVEAFDSRLRALSQTHNALTRTAWESASLRELLTQEFAPYAPRQIAVDGVEVALRPRQALALGMVFHELATNAAKYGALSTPDGCVRVSWTVAEAANRLEVDWSESGGPPVEPPRRQGFGTRLLRTAVAGELGGEFDIIHGPAGLACRLVVPLANAAG